MSTRYRPGLKGALCFKCNSDIEWSSKDPHKGTCHCNPPRNYRAIADKTGKNYRIREAKDA